MANKICFAIESLKMPHSALPVSPYVTCSLGVASVIPNPTMNPTELSGWLIRHSIHRKQRAETVCVFIFKKIKKKEKAELS
ncbi:hypothetical protein P9245_01730 [Schinkia azotoformans]|nr:hypothetical protein [Schinkia azotoformans]MED4327897.1 hypothetical protein [Schinkia azotoformans]